MKNKELVGAVNCLNTLGNVKLGGILTKKLLSNKSKMIDAINFYEDTRKALLEQYADKDEQGKPVIADNEYKMTEENRISFSQEIQLVLEANADVELQLFNPGLLDQFTDLTMAQTEILLLMVENNE